MTDLAISSAAEGDYAAALCWYAERSVQAAERFEVEFEHALDVIASDPERFPRCNGRHRYFLMHHFPFQVIFRRHEDHLVVIAVAHTSRKPRYWVDR